MDNENDLVSVDGADGTIQVALKLDGTLDSIVLERAAMRLTAAELGAELTTAIRFAQEEVARRAAQARAPQEEASQRLAEELDQINAEFLRQTAEHEDITAKIARWMER